MSKSLTKWRWRTDRYGHYTLRHGAKHCVYLAQIGGEGEWIAGTGIASMDADMCREAARKLDVLNKKEQADD